MPVRLAVVAASLSALLGAGCGGGHARYLAPDVGGDAEADADADGDTDEDLDADPDDDPETCESSCAVAGQTRCSGYRIETCVEGVGGCRSWAATDSCDAEMWCEDRSEGATCTCDECGAAGDTRCDGRGAETCVRGEDGCLRWVQTEDCAAEGVMCVEGAAGAACSCDGEPGRTPCGSELTCDEATEVCVVAERHGQWGNELPTEYECRPVPDGCLGDRTCLCMTDLFCCGSPYAVGECRDYSCPNVIVCGRCAIP
jgi:hypothetical protein